MKEDQHISRLRPSGVHLSGVTLVELLLVVAVIGILASGALLVVSNVRESTRVSKLEADVATINRAIDLYRAHGGVLPGSADPNDILTQLKKAASAKYPGFSGRAVDVRLRAVMQTGGESLGSGTRAIWDSAQKRFVIAASGSNGVQRFEFDDTFGSIDYGTDDTRKPPIELAASDSWVWGHQDRNPLPPVAETRPGRSGEGSGIDPVAKAALTLNPPTFSHPPGEYSLLNFANLDVILSHGNPSGTTEIWFIKGGVPALYKGESISMAPGETLMAYAHSIDPDHYRDSEQVGGPYVPKPHDLTISVTAPSAVSWVQAGGAMADGSSQEPQAVTATVDVSEIPEAYRGGSYYGIVSTTDGSEPLAGEAFTGFSPGAEGVSVTIPLSVSTWGGAATLVVKTAAKAINETFFRSSAVHVSTIGITPTALAAPTIDPPSGQKAADLPVSMMVNAASVPQGYRIYYTLDGSDPGVDANGNPVIDQRSYQVGDFISTGAGSGGMVTVTARVYGPAGQGLWFTPSPPTTRTYNTITLAEGALVGAANLNGTFVGSLIYAAPSSGGSMSNITFNSNARIMNGNLYLPGTPTIRRTNGTEWSLANDNLFAPVIQGWEFDAAGVKTVQTTPRVLDENGSIMPNNYSVTFNNSAILEGKVIRRHDAPAFPTIDPPPPPDSTGSTSLNNSPPGPISASQYSSVTINTSAVGDVRLLGGNYGNLTANNGTAFVLGDPDNPEVTQYYSFNSLNLNSSSDLKIVGKVIITVSGTINLNNGSVLGNADHPEWMQLQFSSGGLNANSGSSIYGQLVAPNGNVVFNAGSVFTGSVTANSLTINSNSIVFNLPPVIEN